MLKTISWNYRDLGGLSKVEAIKEIIKSEKPHILVLQETKMLDVEAMALSCLFWKNRKGKSISSRGASGGTATIILLYFLKIWLDYLGSLSERITSTSKFIRCKRCTRHRGFHRGNHKGQNPSKFFRIVR